MGSRGSDFRREHPLCIGCQAMGRVEPATLVDHIKPHRGDQAKFWDRANWQSCCAWHHNEVKKALEHKWDLGLIAIADLRLDSAAAIELSRSRGTWISDDGWPRL